MLILLHLRRWELDWCIRAFYFTCTANPRDPDQVVRERTNDVVVASRRYQEAVGSLAQEHD